MMKIIYGHSPDNFQNLKVAGDFSDWKPLSMVRNSSSGLWEYEINPDKVPANMGKVHFKFIDDNGVWFTDEDYPKEVDEHSNENNVKLLPVKGEDDQIEAGEEVDYEGPESPAPSLKGQNEDGKSEPAAKSLAQPASKQAVEDKDEPVGGSAVLVNHSDAEDDRQITPGSYRPASSGTALSGGENNPEQYKDVLARIIAFFTNLFRSWFG